MQPRSIHFVSGDWVPGSDRIRIRIETEGPDEPQDFFVALSDLSAFATLLLVLGKQAGRLVDPREPDPGTAVPVPVDVIDVGETTDGQALLQVSAGQTTLAFTFPQDAAGQLGRTLLALSATVETGSA